MQGTHLTRQNGMMPCVDRLPTSISAARCMLLAKPIPKGSTYVMPQNRPFNCTSKCCAQTVAGCLEHGLHAHEQPLHIERQLTRRIKAVRSCWELAKVFEMQSHRFNSIHITAALSRLTHLAQEVSNQQEEVTPLANQLLQLTSEQLCHMDARSVATILWSVACIKHPIQPDLLQQLSDAALQRLPQSNAQDIGMIVWALAKIGFHPGHSWLEMFTFQLQPKLRQLNAQALAILAYSLGVFKHRPSEQWMSSFLHHAHQKLHDFTGEGHASAVWGLMRMGQPVTTQWANHINSTLVKDASETYTPSTLSTVILSLGSASTRKAITRPTSHNGNSHTLQQSTTISGMWHTESDAIAEGHISQQALHCAAASALEMMPRFSCSQAQTLLWGFAHLQYHPGSDFMQRFFQHTATSLHTLDSPSLVNLALALKRLSALVNRQSGAQHSGAGHKQQKQSIVPAEWANLYLNVTYNQLQHMSTRQLITCGFCLASLGIIPSSSWQSCFLRLTMAPLAHRQLKAVDIMCLTTTVCIWQSKLPVSWTSVLVGAFTATLQAGSHATSPYHSSRTLLGLARLQVDIPTPVIELLEQQFLYAQSEQVQPSDKAVLRKARGLLGKPDACWIDYLSILKQ